MLARLFGGWHEFRVSYIESKYLRPRQAGQVSPFSSLEVRLSVILDLHQGVSTRSFVDASNLYVYLIDALWAIYPDIRFILGVRHVRDFVLSSMARGWHERDPEELMIFPGDPGYSDWRHMEPVQRMAFLWTHRNGLALRAFGNLPASSWTVVKIEDLDTEEQERLARHAGVAVVDPEAVSRGVNKGPNLEMARALSLTDREEKSLMEMAEPVMTRLGYIEPKG